MGVARRGARPHWPLVGRNAEIDVLSGATARGAVGAVVTGPLGVGRTRLAREVAAAARREGRPVHVAAASAAAAAEPLGALAHLLPDGANLHSAAIALAAGPEPPLLVVDDAHLLDPTTVTLLHRLVAARTTTLVATVPAGGPDPLADLWRDDHVVRLDVAPLSRTGVDDLLAVVLDGHLDSRTGEQLWRLSHGSPRVLRELVEDGRATGELRCDDGLWHWPGAMRPGARLTGIVLAQLGPVDPAQRAALDVLAVAGPLPVHRLVDLVGRPAVAGLERAGLVAVDRPTEDPGVGPDAGSARVRAAHPVHAAVLAAQLPAAETETIRRDLAPRAADPGPGRTEELAADHAAHDALLDAGRLDELTEAAGTLLRRSLAGPRSARDALAAFHLGGAALAAGRVDRAARWLTEAAHGLSRDDPLHLRPLCIARLATARALLGAPGAAGALLASLHDLDPSVLPHVRRAEVWIAASDEPGDAAALALDAAGHTDRPALRTTLLHDAVRLGRAEDAAGPLRGLATGPPLAAAAAEHAEALLDADAARLDAVSTRFEQLGALLPAADTAADAAALHHRAGHRRRSAAAAGRAAALGRRCGDPRTPALTRLVAPRLTARERDVAELAAGGSSNQVIARKLVLSVRTVETHLAHAYTKLAISGRAELARALDAG